MWPELVQNKWPLSEYLFLICLSAKKSCILSSMACSQRFINQFQGEQTWKKSKEYFVIDLCVLKPFFHDFIHFAAFITSNYNIRKITYYFFSSIIILNKLVSLQIYSNELGKITIKWPNKFRDSRYNDIF